ncbi:hypothetical protein Efla_007045 [Eimeria flavescens]
MESKPEDANAETPPPPREEQQPEEAEANEAVPPDEGVHLEIPSDLPDPSKRRKSAVVAQDQAGCYLLYDQNQAKWVAFWSSVYVPEAVAILTPHVKVPQFKYNKREKVILEGEKKASKDVKHDYLAGLCGFFKIVRDFKGDLTLLPSAEDLELKERVLIGLHGNEIVRFDKYDFTYPFVELDCIALVPKSSVAFNSKQMEQAIFMGKASREGFGLSLKSRP